VLRAPSSRVHYRPGRTVLGAVRAIHPLPVTATVITSIAMVALVHRSMPPISLLARCGAVVLLSQICVGALNDYVDRDTDALYQPEKPIAQGAISPRAIIRLSTVAAVLMLPVAASLGPLPLMLALIGTAWGIAYDLWLKRTTAALLAYIAGFLTLLTFACACAGRFAPVLILAYGAAALIVTSAHLAQSFPDIENDKLLGLRSPAVVLGPTRSAILMGGCYAVVAIGGLGWAFGHGRLAPVACILPGSIAMAAACRLALRNPERRPLRKQVFRLAAPGFALLAVGVLLAVQPDL
jgi:4-hydroxybenzoate polyprenyltransferase